MPDRHALLGATGDNGAIRYVRVGDLRSSRGSAEHTIGFWGGSERRLAGLIAIGNLAAMDVTYISRPNPQGQYLPARWPAPGQAAIAADRDELFETARIEHADTIALYVQPDWAVWRVFPRQARSALRDAIDVAERARVLIRRASAAFTESEHASVRRQGALRTDARAQIRTCSALLGDELDGAAMESERWRGIVQMMDCRKELAPARRKGSFTGVALDHVDRAERQIGHGLEIAREMMGEVVGAEKDVPEISWTMAG